MLSVSYLWKTCGENVLLARNLPTVNVNEDITIFLTDYHKLWYNYLVRGSETLGVFAPYC